MGGSHVPDPDRTPDVLRHTPLSNLQRHVAEDFATYDAQLSVEDSLGAKRAETSDLNVANKDALAAELPACAAGSEISIRTRSEGLFHMLLTMAFKECGLPMVFSVSLCLIDFLP